MAERVSKSVDEVVGQASRDLDIMAEALGGKPTAPEPTPAASPAPAPARAPAPQPTPTPTVMPTVNLSVSHEILALTRAQCADWLIIPSKSHDAIACMHAVSHLRSRHCAVVDIADGFAMPFCRYEQEADQFEQLADGPRGVKALEAALSDPDHVLTRLTNSLDDEVLSRHAITCASSFCASMFRIA